MVEKKRFSLNHMPLYGLSIVDNKDGGYCTTDEQDLENLCQTLNELYEENEELRQKNKKILDTINNKITEKGINWYGAEDNSKEEKEANLQLKVLEEIREELKEILNLIKGD